MNSRNREKLIECERKLLQANVLSDEQVEQIVTAPHLFKAVRARIEAEKAAGKTIGENINLSNDRAAKAHATSVWQQIIALKNARLIAVTTAILIVVGAGFAWRYKTESVIPASSGNLAETVAIQSDTDSPLLESPKPIVSSLVAETTSTAPLVPARNNSSKLPRTAFRLNAKNTNQAKNKTLALQTKHVDKPLRKKMPAPKEFYQLAFAGALEPDETKQIVRVKLSPGALVQLGAAAPAKVLARSQITADLLLGEDGTPRAIRYVN